MILQLCIRTTVFFITGNSRAVTQGLLLKVSTLHKTCYSLCGVPEGVGRWGGGGGVGRARVGTVPVSMVGKSFVTFDWLNQSTYENTTLPRNMRIVWLKRAGCRDPLRPTSESGPKGKTEGGAKQGTTEGPSGPKKRKLSLNAPPFPPPSLPSSLPYPAPPRLH